MDTKNKNNIKNNIKNNNDINVDKITELIIPNDLISKLPITPEIKNNVNNLRLEIKKILNKKSDKKILIVGPCSIHNVGEAKEYANMLSELSKKVSDKLLIVMRVYFEKPRTTVGWKGLINDPLLNNTFEVNNGLYIARELLLYISNLGLATGCEILDTITPQYISDLVSWGAIGARTTESQVHRQLVSGLSMPVGFKNTTTGDYKVAIDAIISAKHPHCFFGITGEGRAAIVKTNGNNTGHIILRGSNIRPNYNWDNILEIEQVYNNIINNIKNDLNPEQKSELLEKQDIEQENSLENNIFDYLNIIIDCSHGNSGKDYRNQHEVWNYCIDNYIVSKSSTVIGYMLESNINAGKQTLTTPDDLKYGISITDSCICFKETEELILNMYSKL
jgi:3-deoxy-7-phosphoheptulonate synthase